jgi:hypothetical protein
MELEKIKRDDWILSGLALLLVISLFASPWFVIGVSLGPVSGSFSATDAPDGWCGVLAALATLALIVDVFVERLSPETALPVLGGSRESTRFVLASIAVGLLALKFLLHIHFGYFGWGFYFDLIVAAAMFYVAHQLRSGRPLVRSRSSASKRRNSSARRRPPRSSPPRS